MDGMDEMDGWMGWDGMGWDGMDGWMDGWMGSLTYKYQLTALFSKMQTSQKLHSPLWSKDALKLIMLLWFQNILDDHCFLFIRGRMVRFMQ